MQHDGVHRPRVHKQDSNCPEVHHGVAGALLHPGVDSGVPLDEHPAGWPGQREWAPQNRLKIDAGSLSFSISPATLKNPRNWGPGVLQEHAHRRGCCHASRKTRIRLRRS